MTTSTLFDLITYLVVPFYLLMTFAPTWSVTKRIASSPWIVVPPLVIWAILATPLFSQLLQMVAQPSLSGFQAAMSLPEAATVLWAMLIAWDLFVGRWIYLDSRERSAHPLAMLPIMIITITSAPAGFLLYLVVRGALTQRDSHRPAETAPEAYAAKKW